MQVFILYKQFKCMIMKKYLFLFVLLCTLTTLSSCIDEDDDKMSLTVNMSAYDVFSTLKDPNKVPYFTETLKDGLQVRFRYLVVKMRETPGGSDRIIVDDVQYVNDIRANISFKTEALEEGKYNVCVVADLVENNNEYNKVITNGNTLFIQCKRPAGVYNAFGMTLQTLLIDKKTSINLNLVRKGSLVTLLFKNNIQDEVYSCEREKFEYFTHQERFSYNSVNWTTTITPNDTYKQHYCPVYESDRFCIAWLGARYPTFILEDGKDTTIEMDFAAQTATEL